MIQLIRSFSNILKLFLSTKKIKSFKNYLPAEINYNGNNIYIQEAKIVGKLNVEESVKINASFLSGHIDIGRFSSINGPNTSIVTSDSGRVVIGSFCSIARGVQIQEFNHNFNRASSYYVFQNIFNRPRSFDITTKGDVIIEDDVWIGANCIILSGVRIGRGSVIAAGSIVNKDVEPYSIMAGVPSRFIKTRFSDSTIELLESSEWWRWDKEKILRSESFFSEHRS